jgi:hypothetical protein
LKCVSSRESYRGADDAASEGVTVPSPLGLAFAPGSGVLLNASADQRARRAVPSIRSASAVALLP